MIRTLVVCAWLLMLSTAARSQRLPRVATPESYNLTFTPDLATDNFTGVVGAETFCDPEMSDEVEHFFASHPIPQAERTLKQSLEAIGYCIDLKSRQG